MARVKVHEANILGEPGGTFGYFDYERIRGRWSDEEPDGSGSRGAGRGEAVILAGNGRARWVLERWTNWQGEAAWHVRLADEDARGWLERNGFTQAVEQHFGGSLPDALHDCAMYGEVSARRDEVIRAARKAGADITQIARLMGVSRPTVYGVLGEEAPGGR